MKEKKDIIWMKVTKDKYRLPVIVADSLEELAERVGTTKESIYNTMLYCKKRGSECQYIAVEITDE